MPRCCNWYEDGLTVLIAEVPIAEVPIAEVPIARIAREEERQRPLLQQIWTNLDIFSK